VSQRNLTKRPESGGIAAGAEHTGDASCTALETVEQAARPEKLRSQDGEPGKNHEPARARSEQQNHTNGEEGETEERFDGPFDLSHSGTSKSGGSGWASVATPEF